jgi:hypothetical protein
MLLGLAAGTIAATALSAWVLLLAPPGGSRTVGRVAPISAHAAVAAYFAALPAAGALAGLLWPLGRSRPGAAVVGTLCALVRYGSIEAAKGTLFPMRALDAVTLGVLALVVGVPAGLGYREIFGVRGHPRRRRPDRDASTPPAS